MITDQADGALENCQTENGIKQKTRRTMEVDPCYFAGFVVFTKRRGKKTSTKGLRFKKKAESISDRLR